MWQGWQEVVKLVVKVVRTDKGGKVALVVKVTGGAGIGVTIWQGWHELYRA